MIMNLFSNMYSGSLNTARIIFIVECEVASVEA